MERLAVAIEVLIACSLLLAACGPPAINASTPQTESNPVALPLVKVTDTQVPTVTQQPTSTSTPIPTSTPTFIPTETPLPSNTPTSTRTPGPFSFIDDFSSDSGGWQNCAPCSWKNGGLLMGPFEPTSNFHKNYCTGCGEHTFYKLSVEGTFVDGQVDRFFGVFVGDNNGKQYYFGISPWQLYIIGQHTDEGDSWEVLDAQWSGTVKASYATNKFEVSVVPAYQRGTADYIFSLNGSTIYILNGRPAVGSRVGLAMDWHAVSVNYDNWSYEEIEP